MCEIPAVSFFTETNFPDTPESDSLSSIRETPSPLNTARQIESLLIQIEHEYGMTKPVKPEKLDAIQVGSDSILFYPSLDPSDGLAISEWSRDLEEDGLFVNDKPSTQVQNINQMRNRLLDESWFEPNGDFVNWRDPVSSSLYRPVHSNAKFKPRVTIIDPVFHSTAKIAATDVACMLHIQINKLTFKHHHLFSTEHVLAQRLRELMDQYDARQRHSVSKRLLKKLNAVRHAHSRLAYGVGNNDDISDQQQERIVRAANEITELKSRWLDESRIDRELLLSVLQVWKHIKAIRNKQNYWNTNVKLAIRPTECDEEAEQQFWYDQLELHLLETVRNMEYEFNLQMQEYKTKLKEYKKQRKVHGASIERPIKPVFIMDSEEIKAKLVKHFQESLKPPGEPDIKLTLHCVDVDDRSLENSKEKQRIEDVHKTKMFVKICLDGAEACRSDPVNMTDDFQVIFNKCFSIQLSHSPKNIKIEIHEQHGVLNRRKLADVYVALPDNDVSFESANNQLYTFTNTDEVSWQHQGVGSGDAAMLNDDVIDAHGIYIAGEMDITLGWDSKDVGKSNKYSISEPTERVNLSRHLSAGNKVKLFNDWLEQGLIDPNEPDYGAILQYIKSSSTGFTDESNKCFRLNPDIEFFCSEDAINNDSRLQHLSLRFKQVALYKDMRLIPVQSRNLMPSFKMKGLKSSSDGESDTERYCDDVERELHEWDRQRYRGRKYMQHAYEAHAAAVNKSVNEDIVNEPNTAEIILIGSVPNFRSLLLSFLNVFSPRRPLRPSRRAAFGNDAVNTSLHSSYKLGGTAGSSEDSRSPNRIVVHVVRALNVPVRSEELSSPFTRRSDGSSQISHTAVNVRPFVSVSYRNYVARTGTAEGSSPTWNQEITIPIQSLSSLSGSLYLNLYDEQVQEIMRDDRSSEIHQRLSSHWLGGVRIPLHSLQTAHRIEGTMKLVSPCLLLGYQPAMTSVHSAVDLGVLEAMDSGTPTTESFSRAVTYLTVYMSVEPRWAPVERLLDAPALHSGEPRPLQEHLAAWTAGMRALFPERHFSPLVTLLSGRTVCVTRLIARIELPPLDVVTCHSVARFVSMIPIEENENKGSSLGLQGIWLTADKLLHLLYGAARDLAVLLCCYFHSMDVVPSYVLCGRVLGRGDSALVLTKGEGQWGEWWLWDPTTGEKVRAQDNMNALQAVYCLVGNDNIWANIQSESRAHMTRWNVSRSRDWRPCFPPSTPKGGVAPPVDTVQPMGGRLPYLVADNSTGLQQRIVKRIASRLEKWRKHRTTIWNRFGNETLMKILPSLELDSICNTNSQRHIAKLQHLFLSYKVHGFPINMPYTKMSNLVEIIRATGIYLNEDENVEFSLAVHVHPYPSNVFSVWVFIAALVARKY